MVRVDSKILRNDWNGCPKEPLHNKSINITLQSWKKRRKDVIHEVESQILLKTGATWEKFATLERLYMQELYID